LFSLDKFDHAERRTGSFARSLASANLRQGFLKAGLVPAASGPEELRKRYEDWMVIFGKIASDAAVKPHQSAVIKIRRAGNRER